MPKFGKKMLSINYTNMHEKVTCILMEVVSISTFYGVFYISFMVKLTY